MNENAREELEDTQDDVLRKAFAMAGITPRPLPEKAEDQQRFLSEKLHLDPSAWLSMNGTLPSLPLPGGLARHILPFHEWSLNIWTIDAPEGQIAIDTGLSPEQLISATENRRPSAIIITHLHRDHIGGIAAYPGVPLYSPPDMRPGESPDIAGLHWKTIDLAGHTPNGIGWLTEYKGVNLFFPGDSIFARSIGKCEGNERLAMTNIINAMDMLPPGTIICPGHGPATTSTDEWVHNPFIAPFRH